MNKWVKFGLGIAVSLASLGWALKDTKIDATLTAVKSASWGTTLLIYFWMLVGIHVFRTLRWGNLLSGIEKVPFKALNEASAIGFMMLVVLPFRLGEFARPFLIAQRSTIRRSAAMTTVVLERITDILVIAVMLQVLMFFLPREAPNYGVILNAAVIMFLVSVGGFSFLLLARWKHELVVGLIRKVFGFLGPARADKVVDIVDGFVGALNQLPDAKNFGLFLLWTAGYWAVNGYGMMVFANGFDCSGAAADATCHALQLTPFMGYFLLCVVIIGMLIPAGPAGAGTTQAALIVGMQVFFADDVVNSSGVAFSIALWLVQVVQQILFGLFFMIRSHASFSDIAGKLSAEQQSAQREGT
ncbi:MAG TPA: lysylphosphatidylglycerol synthase transmembrane domain-containing protein [Archangium sp.]